MKIEKEKLKLEEKGHLYPAHERRMKETPKVCAKTKNRGQAALTLRHC
jgi:hypothetical protein